MSKRKPSLRVPRKKTIWGTKIVYIIRDLSEDGLLRESPKGNDYGTPYSIFDRDGYETMDDAARAVEVAVANKEISPYDGFVVIPKIVCIAKGEVDDNDD